MNKAIADLITEIQATESEACFTGLFNRGYELLALDDQTASRVFDTSEPTIRRWRRGVVVPPVAGLVLKFLVEELRSADVGG